MRSIDCSSAAHSYKAPHKNRPLSVRQNVAARIGAYYKLIAIKKFNSIPFDWISLTHTKWISYVWCAFANLVPVHNIKIDNESANIDTLMQAHMRFLMLYFRGYVRK